MPRYESFQCIETGEIIHKDTIFIVNKLYYGPSFRYPMDCIWFKLLETGEWEIIMTNDKISSTPKITSIYEIRYV